MGCAYGESLIRTRRAEGTVRPISDGRRAARHSAVKGGVEPQQVVADQSLSCMRRMTGKAHAETPKSLDEHGHRDALDGSRLTAVRLGTGSSGGSRTTSLARPRTIVVHGATRARRSRGIATVMPSPGGMCGTRAREGLGQVPT